MDLTIRQACAIYSDLIDAYYGESSYNGHECEIYSYRLMINSPKELHTKVHTPENRKLASDNLISLIELLEEAYEPKTISIEGVSYKKWHKVHGKDFDHRVHITIKP